MELGELLNDIDRQSPVWLKLKKYFEDRRDELRKQNDNPKLNAEDTALIRGEIRAINRALSRAEPLKLKTKHDKPEDLLPGAT